jgi:hypothetical protein
MYLYLATDKKRKSKGEWFLGMNSKSIPDKVKEELALDLKTGSVDFVIESPHAKEIISLFADKYPSKSSAEDLLLVKGDHEELAQLLIQLTKDYEADHPSLRLSFRRWLKSVDSYS